MLVSMKLSIVKVSSFYFLFSTQKLSENYCRIGLCHCSHGRISWPFYFSIFFKGDIAHNGLYKKMQGFRTSLSSAEQQVYCKYKTQWNLVNILVILTHPFRFKLTHLFWWNWPKFSISSFDFWLVSKAYSKQYFVYSDNLT